MISDLEAAKQVITLMNDIGARLAESCTAVERRCSAEEYAAYKKATCGLAGSILSDVLEPLYEAHPSLKPAGWDD